LQLAERESSSIKVALAEITGINIIHTKGDNMNSTKMKIVITLIVIVSLQFLFYTNAEVAYGYQWQTKGGTWNFNGPKIIGQGTSGFNKAYWMPSIYNDFNFKVRLRKTSPNDGPIGLLMRYNEMRDEGYMLLIWPHGDYQFSRLVGQTRHRIGSGTPNDLNKGNSSNVIQVIGKGSNMAIYINGNHLVNLNDSQYREGRTGLVIHGGSDQQAEFEILINWVP
jgi:hypothetical protein